MKKECECTDECLGYLTKECKRIEEPKQGLVDYFVEEFFNASRISEWHTGEQEEVITLRQFNDIIQKAKEMEKQQVNDEINTIHEQISELYINENITGFSKRAYAQCLDIVEQFKKK
jgi:uncharacterized protein YwgA